MSPERPSRLPSQGAPLHPRLHLVASLPGHQCRPLHSPLLPHHPGHHHHHYGQVQRHQARGVPQCEAQAPPPPRPCWVARHRYEASNPSSGGNQNALRPDLATVLLPAQPHQQLPHDWGLQSLLGTSLGLPATFPLVTSPLGLHTPRETPGKTVSPGPVLTDRGTSDKPPSPHAPTSPTEEQRFGLQPWLPNLDSDAFI